MSDGENDDPEVSVDWEEDEIRSVRSMKRCCRVGFFVFGIKKAQQTKTTCQVLTLSGSVSESHFMLLSKH